MRKKAVLQVIKYRWMYLEIAMIRRQCDEFILDVFIPWEQTLPYLQIHVYKYILYIDTYKYTYAHTYLAITDLTDIHKWCFTE